MVFTWIVIGSSGTVTCTATGNDKTTIGDWSHRPHLSCSLDFFFPNNMHLTIIILTASVIVVSRWIVVNCRFIHTSAYTISPNNTSAVHVRVVFTGTIIIGCFTVVVGCIAVGTATDGISSYNTCTVFCVLLFCLIAG